MLENAIYSVVSPRACASIVWKDPKREGEAAEALRLTAQDLYEFGMIEGIVPEGQSGAQIIRNVGRALRDQLAELSAENERRSVIPMFEKVCEILADKFDADASTMTMDTKVKEDLNAASLDVVELMMDLEENFGITISDEEATQMSTIGDIVKYIEEHQD